MKALWAAFRDQSSVSRVVTFLTPFLALLAGLVATWLGDLGFDPDESEFTALFISGAAAVVALVFKWLDGRAGYEQTVLAVGSEVQPADEPNPPVTTDPLATEPAVRTRPRR